MKISLRKNTHYSITAHPCSTFSRLGTALLLSMIATTNQADTLSLVDGHAYDSTQFQELTLDIAGHLQDEARRGGLKVTLPKRFDRVVFFAEGWGSEGQLDNLSVTSDVEFSGQGEGVGFYVTDLPDWGNASTTLRVAYHREENNVDSLIAVAGRQATVDYDLRNLSARLLFSPREPHTASGLSSYLAVGVSNHRVRRRVFVDQQLEPALARQDSTVQGYLAAGLVYPVKSLRFYAAMQFQDAISVSAGIRWLVSRTAQVSTLN